MNPAHFAWAYFFITGATPQTLSLGNPGAGFAWAIGDALVSAFGAAGQLQFDVNLRTGSPVRMLADSGDATDTVRHGRIIAGGAPLIADSPFSASIVATGPVGSTCNIGILATRVRRRF